MKTINIKLLSIIIIGGLVGSACNKSSVTPTPAATVYYQQLDEMGRPAINTVFNVAPTAKDSFNTTTPSTMSARFGTAFQSRLLALNPGYTTNALGQDAPTFSGLLVNDVLNVSLDGTTTFFDGVAAHTLSGRKLDDDVINVELLLIFGGPTGASNPALTDDHVNANDKAFLTTFPYLATPW